MKLVLVPPGEFQMGSTRELIEEELRLHGGDGWYVDRLPGAQHQVRITRPYWLGATDVTQEEYQRAIGSNPSKFQGDPKRPVEQVSWNEALEFCRRLSELPGEKAAKRRYALPTEAQWEYACRAGNMGPPYFSAQANPLPAAAEESFLNEYAWFNANADGQTHRVGQKRPNAWGLYDMHGNVWQWCQDWYDKDYYAKSDTDDPAGPPGGTNRAIRGGAWNSAAWYYRLACRNDAPSGHRAHDVGFRVCQVWADK
ncbi:MAG: formylglycine-generating enzyme family protein [Thermoguttaceae bacterium]